MKCKYNSNKELKFFYLIFSYKQKNIFRTKPIQPDEAKEELKRYVESHFLCAKKPLKHIEVTNCETVESYKVYKIEFLVYELERIII